MTTNSWANRKENTTYRHPLYVFTSFFFWLRISNLWANFHWISSEVPSVETYRFIIVNLIISLSLADDPHTCFCRRLIQVARAAMMDLVGIHGWSSLIIGMLESVKKWILIIPFMADGGLQDNPSARTLIWWSNGSINSTLIPACEDIELNQAWTARNLCCKNGALSDIQGAIRGKWNATRMFKPLLI